MKYITDPPVFRSLTHDLPPYLRGRYVLFDKTFIDELIAWANKEYYDMIVHLYTIGRANLAKKLESEYSPYHFLGNSSAFREIEKFMTPEIWRALSKEMKDALILGKQAQVNKAVR
jgi:hypothetical protein